MSPEFRYLWAKDVVLWEMEQDGVLHRARRIAMSAACGSATHRAMGAGLVQGTEEPDGFVAAASVFDNLAASPEGWSARTAHPGEWHEAARRAKAKGARRPGAQASRRT